MNLAQRIGQEFKTLRDDELSTKQDNLVSGTNIKTINGTSVLGSGDIDLSTSLSMVSNELRYTNIDGTVQTVDMSPFMDDTTNTVVSASLSGTSIIFTREDATTFTLDVSDLYDDTNLVTSVAGKAGAVTLVKGDVGLGNVDNTADASKPVSTATQTALDLKAPIASPTFTGTVGGITKSMVGLGSVDNTADSAKAVLSATKLTTARTINGVSFDGTANITVADSTKVVANTAITAGTGTKITYDAKGLVTGSTTLSASDIPTLNQNTTGSSGSCTGNAATATNVAWSGVTSTPTTLSGYGITDAQAALVSGTNIKTVGGTSILGSGDISVGGGVGVGQTWQDVKASRSLATTYTNTTGKPILVVAAISCSSSLVYFTVGGLQMTGVAGQGYATVAFVVPNNTTYSFKGSGTIYSYYWQELR